MDVVPSNTGTARPAASSRGWSARLFSGSERLPVQPSHLDLAGHGREQRRTEGQDQAENRFHRCHGGYTFDAGSPQRPSSRGKGSK